MGLVDGFVLIFVLLGGIVWICFWDFGFFLEVVFYGFFVLFMLWVDLVMYVGGSIMMCVVV